MKLSVFGINDMYKTYQRLFGKNREKELEKELTRLDQSAAYLYKRLESYNIKGKIVEGGNESFREYVKSKVNLYNFDAPVKEKILKITDTLIAVSKLHRRRVTALSGLKQNKVNNIIFNDALNSFNETLIKDELLKGEVFRIPMLGMIFVIKKPRNKNIDVINWPASNKYKAQLIEEGKLPKENYKDNKGNILGDNGGIDWLIKFTDDFSYWLFWKRVCRMQILNSGLYSLTPSRTGFIIPLQEAKQPHRMPHLIFKERSDV